MNSNAFSAADMTTAAQKAVAVWTVTREGDPTFPRAYFSEAAADAMVAHITLAPFAVKRAPVTAAPVGDWDAQAYRQMAGELESWKQRALTAESDFNRLHNAMNAEDGPTHMGEPVLVSRSGLSDQAAAETQASGWKLVCELLTELSPGWANAPGSGLDLALAAIRGLRVNTPAAPGIDLEQFREAVEGRYSLMLNGYEAGHQSANIMGWHEAERDRLLALIDGQADASPKGCGSDVLEALAIAYTHLDVQSMRVSHCNDLAKIQAAMQATSAEVAS